MVRRIAEFAKDVINVMGSDTMIFAFQGISPDECGQDVEVDVAK